MLNEVEARDIGTFLCLCILLPLFALVVTVLIFLTWPFWLAIIIASWRTDVRR